MLYVKPTHAMFHTMATKIASPSRYLTCNGTQASMQLVCFLADLCVCFLCFLRT